MRALSPAAGASLDFTGRRRFLLVAGVGLGGLLAGCRSASLPVVGPASGQDQTAAFLPMVNALRQKNGKPALVVDSQAAQAAMVQARRMAEAETMAHLIGFGDSFGARMRASSVQLPAAENIAMLQRSPEEAMQAWVLSKHHLENMLGPYHGLGVAVARVPSAGNKPYWAMVLSGAPRPEPPGPPDPLGAPGGSGLPLGTGLPSGSGARLTIG